MKVKLFKGTEIRRTKISLDDSFSDFLDLVPYLFKIEKAETKNFTFKYLDEDKDWVTFGSDEEFQEALHQVKEGQTLKIKIISNEKQEEKKKQGDFNFGDLSSILNQFLGAFSQEQEVHEYVSCDGCEQVPIRGVRYKCVSCPNFDFCSKCYAEKKDKHGHEFKQVHECDMEKTMKKIKEMFGNIQCGSGCEFWKQMCDSNSPCMQFCSQFMKNFQQENQKSNQQPNYMDFLNQIMSNFTQNFSQNQQTQQSQQQTQQQTQQPQQQTQQKQTEEKPPVPQQQVDASQPQQQQVKVEDQKPVQQDIKVEPLQQDIKVEPLQQDFKIESLKVEEPKVMIDLTKHKEEPKEVLSNEEELLVSMGFLDKEKNKMMLKQYKNDVQRIVSEYLK